MSLSKLKKQIWFLSLPFFLIFCFATTIDGFQPDPKVGAKKIIVENETDYPLWISFDPVYGNIEKVTVPPKQKGQPNLVDRSIYANQDSIYYLGHGEGAQVQQSKKAEKIAYNENNETSLIANINGKKIHFYIKFKYDPNTKTTTATITGKDLTKEL